MLLILEGTVSY